MKRLQFLCLTVVFFGAAVNLSGQVLKSVVYDFDGLDIGQTDLPEGDYKINDLVYQVAANPLGNSDMLGDRVLQLNLNWSAGNGAFGRGISRFIEFDPTADVLNFYFYNPVSNSANASVEVRVGDDDDGDNAFSMVSDDIWVKNVTISGSSGWQLIAVPLSGLSDSNTGGNGVFDVAFTDTKGMLLFLEFRFAQNSSSNAVYYMDMIAFSEGVMPAGSSILDIPSPVLTSKCPLGAFEGKPQGMQHLIPSDVEGFFPSVPKKIKYVNWFLQFAMDGGTTANVFPGNEVAALLTNGYTPIITWEPLYTGYARLDPVQPRLSNIINGELDAYIDAFADTLKSYNDTVIIRFMHEFEGDWYPWSITHNGNDPTTYITAFRKVVDRFRAKGAYNVKWMWCVNADYAPYQAYNWIVPAYPGDSYVDIVATDIYNNHFPVGAEWWMSFKYKAAESYYYLTKYFPQKPLIICEVGCRERTLSENSNSQTKADWLMVMDKELQSDFTKARGLVFFSGVTECDWRMNSSSQSLAAIETHIWNDDYYFDAGIPASLNESAEQTVFRVSQTSDRIEIKASNLVSNDKLAVEFFTIEGKIVGNRIIQPQSNTFEMHINTSDLAKGIYLVRISNSSLQHVLKAVVN